MFYRDYFTRIEDSDHFCPEHYNSTISSAPVNKQAANLFKDCLSNHVNFNSPNTDSLIYDDKSTTRYITHDNLSSYFINKIYEIPDIINVDSGDKVDFTTFIKEFIESSFSNIEQNDKFNLGSNRLRYVIGNVGEGKSAFIQKIISIINNNDDGSLDTKYKLLPIYINLEDKYNYSYIPVPLRDDFLLYLYRKIFETTHIKFSIYISLANIYGINPESNPILSIKILISYLKENNIRLLIFIDNLDFYHYYYARYSYFSEYNKMQDKSIDENIMWLLSVFSSKENLGHMGLNVMIAARQYVYEDLTNKSGGVKTDIDTSEAFKITIPTEDTIFNTRFALMSDAIDVVLKNKPGAGRDLRDTFKTLKTKLLIDTFKTKDNSPISIINKLGQHGNRSLVSFFSSLNLTYLDYELIDRFFLRQVSALYILYFNNMHKKYTQKQNHFPNLFLNDCVIMDVIDFKEAHKPHMHTYWLKYFMLKILVSKEKIKFSEIMDIFCQVGKYEEHLVRHVAGSLCTANEFRCAEIECNQAGKNFESYKLRATERGKYLFSKRSGIESCFDIVYLQVAVDDQWLSIPNDYVDKIYNSKIEYSHLYETDPHIYIKASIDTVISKVESMLHFVKLLQAAYSVEIEQLKPQLHKYLTNNKLVPNFESISDKILENAEHIVKTLRADAGIGEISRLKSLKQNLKDDTSQVIFFNKYYKSNIKVSL